MGDTMTAENNREALSALLDGELSELEARRLLRDMSDDDAGRLARWQLARDVMQGHQAMPVPAQFNSSLMDALDQTRQGRPAWMHPVTRFAVAASVAMATVVGWQYWDYNASQQAATVASDTRVPRLIDPTLVSQAIQNQGQAQSASLQADNERMDAMMVRHSEFVSRHSGQGVIGGVRFVTQEANKDKR